MPLTEELKDMLETQARLCCDACYADGFYPEGHPVEHSCDAVIAAAKAYAEARERAVLEELEKVVPWGELEAGSALLVKDEIQTARAALGKEAHDG